MLTIFDVLKKKKKKHVSLDKKKYVSLESVVMNRISIVEIIENKILTIIFV